MEKSVFFTLMARLTASSLRTMQTEYFSYLLTANTNLSRLLRAVSPQNRKDTLMTYLEDGHCSFSNNLSENAIRPFTVGRKNWLFSATPKGATASALVYTMVEMAKVNELNIYKYLTYLLEHSPSEDMSDEQLEALTPWSEEVQNVCKN